MARDINLKQRRAVPTREDWQGHKADPEVDHAFKLMFGKSNEEIMELFEGGRSIERADELLFMPRRAFQYYVLAFAKYLMLPKAKGDSDAASAFLRLLDSREERDPGSISEMFDAFNATAHHVAQNQKFYDADRNIYGDFPQLDETWRRRCGRT